MQDSRPLRIIRVLSWIVFGTAVAFVPGVFAWQQRAAEKAQEEQADSSDDEGAAVATDLDQRTRRRPAKPPAEEPADDAGEGGDAGENEGESDDGADAEEPRETGDEPPAASEDKAPADEGGEEESPPEDTEETDEGASPGIGLTQPAEAPADDEHEGEPADVDDSATGSSASGEPKTLDEPAKIDPAGAPAIRSALFNAVQPGVSTAAEVDERWGSPKRIGRRGTLVEQLYEIDPYELVTVTFDVDTVTSIVIDLKEPVGIDELRMDLELADLEPAAVTDEFGAPQGDAYPERGVLLSYAPGTQQKISQVILEPPSAAPFVLRAESRAAERGQDCMDDVLRALELDAQCGRAWWLKAKMLSAMGRQTEAQQAIQEAMRLEPENPRYRFTLGAIMEQTGNFLRAAAETKRAMSQAADEPTLKAEGLLQLGRQLASGPARDYQRAADFHLQAIKSAAALLSDRRPQVRNVAQRVLLEAHLAVANDVAWGNWKQKEVVVKKWLDKAEAISRGAPSAEAGDAARFMVGTQALSAQVGLQTKADPKPWTATTLELGKSLIEQAKDPMRRAELERQLGLALYDALQTYHMQGQYGLALKYGLLAADYLSRSSAGREDAGFAYLLGRLYFRIGVIHAIHNRDHDEAVVWFTKAVPLMEKQIPESALGDIGRQGETLVSMAISFWETGNRREAMRLTNRGARLMEQAVKQRILPPRAMAVAYGNLSHMHKMLGDGPGAEQFEQMAAEIKGGVRR